MGKLKILNYATCGHISTDEATHIKCDKSEIKKALKIFNSTFDVPRLTLDIDKKTVYLYNDKCSGYKRASLEKINNYDYIISYCCERKKGRKRVQRYTALFVEILKLIGIKKAKIGQIIQWTLDESHAEGFRGPHQAKVAAIGNDHYCVYAKYGPDMIPFTMAKIIK